MATGSLGYEKSIAELGAALRAKQLTARELVLAYLERIAALDQRGPQLRSVIEVNPDVLEIADGLDRELSAGQVRGPLHGIPILIKDNIDTADKMLTTAGSLALANSRPTADATVVTLLRDAGAIILGKTNLSEWANFRSFTSLDGWSSRGRQTRNPYVLDRTPSGSSSGSAVAVAASLAAAAIGTETNGSIVSPASACGIVGLKPTVGLVSRAGVIPIAHSQDTVGPMTRSVADAAALLSALTAQDARDEATIRRAGEVPRDYSAFLDIDGLRGARIGVARQGYFGYSKAADAIVEAAIATMKALGADIIDPADIPTAAAMASSPALMDVLLYEFKAEVNEYLASRIATAPEQEEQIVRSLADVIAFNTANSAQVLPYAGQEILVQAEGKGPLSDEAYQEAIATTRRLSRQEGIDAVMDALRLDALVAPTTHAPTPIDLLNGSLYLGGSSTPAALAGYPLISLPAGYVQGLPVGLTLMGRAYSEPTLIKLAYAFEQATQARRPPQFLATLDLP